MTRRQCDQVVMTGTVTREKAVRNGDGRVQLLMIQIQKAITANAVPNHKRSTKKSAMLKCYMGHSDMEAS